MLDDGNRKLKGQRNCRELWIISHKIGKIQDDGFLLLSCVSYDGRLCLYKERGFSFPSENLYFCPCQIVMSFQELVQLFKKFQKGSTFVAL